MILANYPKIKTHKIKDKMFIRVIYVYNTIQSPLFYRLDDQRVYTKKLEKV